MTRRGTISAIDIVDGMGTRRGDGSYVEFAVQEAGLAPYKIRMSLGGAEALLLELNNILMTQKYSA